MNDDWFLSRYRKMNIVLGSADWDICLDQNVKFSAILNDKGIPHWLDVWGDNSKHDWPLWQRMAVKYFSLDCRSAGGDARVSRSGGL